MQKKSFIANKSIYIVLKRNSEKPVFKSYYWFRYKQFFFIVGISTDKIKKCLLPLLQKTSVKICNTGQIIHSSQPSLEIVLNKFQTFSLWRRKISQNGVFIVINESSENRFGRPIKKPTKSAPPPTTGEKHLESPM